MTLELSNINYLAVLVGIVINMAGGALWYSPLLFANPWMAENGFTMDQISADKAGQRRGYALSIIASIVIVMALAVLVQLTGANTAAEGLLLGMVAGLGFIATTQGANYTFESRSLRIYMINAGYPIVMFALIGIVLALWQ